jgi:hypothetical protein
MLHRRSLGLDALALDENLAGLEHDSGIDLKQPRGVQDDGRDRRVHGLLRESRFAKDEDGANGEKDGTA